MSDIDLFESRFLTAYRAYVTEIPTQVDAAALAQSVVSSRRLTRLAGWSWPRIPGRAAVWAAVALLVALALGASLVGSTPTPAPTATPIPSPAPTYPVVARILGFPWMSRAVSGDELWVNGDGGLWHYVGEAWQGPINNPPPLSNEMLRGLAVGPDGELWVAGEATVAVLRDGTWRVAWKDDSPLELAGLDVAPDGTVWVARGHELVGLRPDGAGYAAGLVSCPRTINRLAAATDGTIYVGGFYYAGGEGLARSDGTACALIDPLGDGRVLEVGELSAGPAGSLLATVFEENGGTSVRVWVVLLRGGRWSTISGPTIETGLTPFQAMDPGGHPWRINGDLGLQRYEDGVWRVVAASAGSLVMAPDGVLWYETGRGIERMRTDEVGTGVLP